MGLFEFGNELTPFVNVDTYSNDVLVLRGLIDKYYPDASSRPRLVANDANPDPRYLATVLNNTKGAIDVATWHMYIGYGLDPYIAADAWNVSFINKIATVSGGIIAGVQSVESFAGHELWVGESAMAWHSGAEGVTDNFKSSPWYLSALAGLAPTHAGFCRQTLAGGRYELFNKTTKMPNPDFYLARLFKDAMGARVISATAVSKDSYVHTYANCAPGGGVTLAFINFNTTETTIDVSGVGAAAPRMERVLTATAADGGRSVDMNGAELAYVAGSLRLPSLQPRAVTDPAAPIVLPGHSLGFITFPGAGGVCEGPDQA